MPSKRRPDLRILLALAPSLVIPGWILFSEARVFQTQEKALQAAFSDCQVKRETHYLTPPKGSVNEDLPSVVVRYRARCKDPKKDGDAYFDTHTVKTRKQTLMIVIGKDSQIQKIEVLAFDEPDEYLATEKWYQQFQGKKLDAELELKRGIPFVTGATLTARSSLLAARRILRIHQLVSR